jgi:hypothetical protein
MLRHTKFKMRSQELLPVAFLSNMKKIHTITPYSFKIHGNIGLTSTPKSSEFLSSLLVFKAKFCLHSFEIFFDVCLKNFKGKKYKNIYVLAFFVMTPCSLIGSFQFFRGTWYVHLQGGIYILPMEAACTSETLVINFRLCKI